MTRHSNWKPLRQSTYLYNAWTDEVNFMMSEASHEDRPWLRRWYGVSLDGYDF